VLSILAAVLLGCLGLLGLVVFGSLRGSPRRLALAAALAYALVAVLGVGTIVELVNPSSALAQAVPVTDPSVPSIPGDPSVPSENPFGGYAVYLLGLLIVVEAAKRLAALLPGKKVDEFEGYLGSAELLLRRLVDFLAGRGKHPEDQSAVKHE